MGLEDYIEPQIDEQLPPPWDDMNSLRVKNINQKNVHLVAEYLIQNSTLVADQLLRELQWQLNDHTQQIPKGAS
jgi:hypothetical protein